MGLRTRAPAAEKLMQRVSEGPKLGNSDRDNAESSFRGDSPDALKIRGWIRNNVDRADLRTRRQWATNSRSGAELWEAAFRRLISEVASFQGLSEWEALPAKIRMRKYDHIAKLSRDLAIALYDPVLPAIPSALELLPDLVAQLLVDQMQEDARECVADFAGDRRNPTSLSEGLDIFFRGRPSHELIVLLLLLSEKFRNYPTVSSRAKRQKTGDVDARLLAGQLSTYFERTYKQQPAEVIAACVALAYPAMKSPPNAEDIRKWLGKK